MSVTLYVAGSPYTHGDILKANILDVFAPTGDTCTVQFTHNDTVSEYSRLPQVGEELRIAFADDQGHSNNLFAGIISEVGFTHKHPHNILEVSCEDFTRRMDSKLVSGIYVESTVEEMVQAILLSYAPNFDRTTYIASPGLTSILPKSFDWKTVSECLQEIAEEKGYVWWVDYSGAVHFIPTTSLTNQAPISYLEPKANLDVGGFRFTTSISELKNTILVKEFFYRSPNFLYQPGDNAFPGSGLLAVPAERHPLLQLQYEPYADDFGSMTVEIKEGAGDWTSYTVRETITQRVPGSGDLVAGSAYVDVRAKNILLVRAAGGDFPANTIARIYYRPILQASLPEIVSDLYSIQEFGKREEYGTVAGDGEYQHMISFGSLEFGGEQPVLTLIDYINSILEKDAWPRIEGTFTTFWDGSRNSGSYGWRAGQIFRLFQPEWNLWDWQLKYLLDSEKPVKCYVKSVRTAIINEQVLKYDITFTSVLGG
uniref:Tail protein n=1 Tax=viral metagenome TaxID=1070528 RepID=A0A6H1ZTB8_9ZZZZ